MHTISLIVLQAVPKLFPVRVDSKRVGDMLRYLDQWYCST